ncbi:ATP-binding protein [Dyadobacter sp. CY312]|uniref:ATP-binding protein n=1 Tax=Dyadobacter sp. CY312 TaxID=2907303 RepID=UPI001F2DE3F5|nr:ATP-binding protein [Dyadobacter sp. CY312]MCE7040481.1 ATP-binding protein [Dyadobacter sp. CY312]
MKIKSKLRLGIGFLFAMIILLSLVAAVFVNLLKNDTKNVLADNYKTLEYGRNMLLALDEMPGKPAAWKNFEAYLKQQSGNITEPGEAFATKKVADQYAALKTDPGNAFRYKVIKKEISELMRINMAAIQQKSNMALQTVQVAYTWIAITGTICVLLALTLLINLPGTIANPIGELTRSIREIAAKNYSQRVHFNSQDEFGELAGSFNTMAEKLEEYNNSNLSRILIEKKRIEALIGNMHEPVIGLDENKTILFANGEAAKIIGIALQDMTGKSAIDLSKHNDLMRSLISNLGTDGAESIPELSPLKICADNKESFFEKEIVDITITPTGEKKKLFIGQVIILKNITPFKELDAAKTNFIATVSHELKTPIASVKMSLQLLENAVTGPLNEQQKQLVESIKEDGDRLLKITGELLNLSQVETGNIQLNITQTNVKDIVDYALNAVKISAEQKQIRLCVDKEENLPAIKADTEKTAWVLINFLTNAIRYTQQEGMIKVSVRDHNERVQFSVTDEGKGIDSKYRTKVFERYFQVPGSQKTGTGLGLAISKEFIEAQGGTIGVETEIGMGSTFFFDLVKA